MVTLMGTIFTQNNLSRIKKALDAYHLAEDMPHGSSLDLVEDDTPEELRRVVSTYHHIEKLQQVRNFGLIFTLQTHAQFYALWEDMSNEFEEKNGPVYDWFRRRQKEHPMPGKQLKSWLSDTVADLVYPDKALSLEKKKSDWKAAIRLGHIVQDVNDHFPGLLGMAPDDSISL